MTKTTPRFFVATPEECIEFLESHHIGRVAFLLAGQVDIEPVSYVARGKWIFMRSAYGAKLEAFARHPYVAFEVDEVDGPFDWRSVVAHGTIYMLPEHGAPIEQQEFDRAVRELRRIMPDALTAADPVPERVFVYGMHIDRLSGRTARSAPTRANRRRKPAPKRRGAPRRRNGT